MDELRKIEIIGVPTDLGCDIKGAVLGPGSIRLADLQQRLEGLDYSVKDRGDILLPPRSTLQSSEEVRPSIVETCKRLSDEVYKALCADSIALTLGGDHSIAIGSVAGFRRWSETQTKRLGLIWFDAHADMNTDASSLSGNVHGMPLAAILGLGSSDLTTIAPVGAQLPPKLTAIVGLRDVDRAEKRICLDSGVHVYTMRDIDELGMARVMDELNEKLIANVDDLHVSFDLDVIDPQYAPGVSTPVAGGLSVREAHLALEMLAESGKLSSADFVELNPLKDKQGRSVHLCVELILSLFGSSIL